MESVLERMERDGTRAKIASFEAKQAMPYDFKKKYAAIRVREFVRECDVRGLNTHVSVGGLDSITLLAFIRSLGFKDIPGVSVSNIEDASIQKVHKQLGVIPLKSAVKCVDKNGVTRRWTKREILQEFGFPVLSKEIAGKINLLQNPTEKNATVRHAIITGETGEYGGWQKNSRMKLAQKWLELFGGYENETEGVNYGIPNFLVSDRCCYYLKEKPCDEYARENNSVPFLGLMASEGGRREKALKMHGCNYFGSTTIRSCPFAIFNRQDILQLSLDLNVPVPEIYGEIVRDKDGTLRTTGAQRTGCSMCGFGIQLETRPHRFDHLYERNPKEWDFWMNRCCRDEDGTQYGWGRVLDYIGVGWRQPIDQCPGQMTIMDFLEDVT